MVRLFFLLILLVWGTTSLEDNYAVYSDGIWLAKGEPLNKQVVVSLLGSPGVNQTFTGGTETVGFGYSVVIDDEWMAISAPWVNDNAGTTFVYRWDGTTWNLFRELAPLSNVKSSFYGKKQVLYNGWLLVTQEGSDVNLQDKAGAVYLYQFTGIDWALRTIITAGAPEEDAFFGSCVGFDGFEMVVGARGHGTAGTLFYFTYNHTTDFFEERVQIPYPVEGVTAAEFGYDCAILDDIIVAGSYKGSGNTGDVHLFRKENGIWVNRQIIQPIQQITTSGAKFGSTLDLKRTAGDYTLMLVGAPNALDLGDYVNGAASIYNYNNFTTDPCFTHQETFFATETQGVDRGMGVQVQLINNTQAMVLSTRNNQLYFYDQIDSYTIKPTSAPSAAPSSSPTLSPSSSPSASPTVSPTRAPTDTGATRRPTLTPIPPTLSPSDAPSSSPTGTPTGIPSVAPEEDTSTSVAITAGIIVGALLSICIAWGLLASRREQRDDVENEQRAIYIKE